MWCQTLGARESIEIVEMDDVPYSRAFAFAVKDFMAAWAPNTFSFLVDSTCEYFKEPLPPLLNILVVNTNKSNMELFGGLADMDGEGLPLSFLFVVTSAEAPPHTKERVLVNWMAALKTLGIAPEFTFSDKDQKEINALRQFWPTAKHQLCFWHVQQALKRRLVSNQEPPAYYRSMDAKKIFPFIDPTFLPLGQMPTNDKVHIYT